MADARLHDVAVAEVGGDGFRLCRRLHDDETGAHLPDDTVTALSMARGLEPYRRGIGDREVSCSPCPNRPARASSTSSSAASAGPCSASCSASARPGSRTSPARAVASSPPTTGRTSTPGRSESPLFPRRFMRFMAKSELFWPPLGWLIKGGGGFRVRRGQRDDEAMETAVRLCREGHVVVMFPEGTRRRKGMRKKYEARWHTGAARIALEAGVPLIPAGIAGHRARQPAGADQGRVRPGARSQRPRRR